jgi:hypothetical protein
MIFEFVGFEAYEAACERDVGLLGFSPMDTSTWLGISNRIIFRAVEDGALDLCRIINLNGSILFIIPLTSIRQFKFPYLVESWHSSCKSPRRRLNSWQLLLLQADQIRGAWFLGVTRAVPLL